MHHRLIRLSTLTLATLAALPAPAWALRINYSLDAGVEHNSNVALTPDNPSRQNLLRAGMGFQITQESSRIQASLDGRLDYRDYRELFADSLNSSLNGRINWSLLPERLSLVVEDNLQMVPVDALIPQGPGNRQRINVFSMGPNTYFRLSPSLQGQLELRYIDTRAQISDDFNSGRISAALRIAKELNAHDRLSFNAHAQRVDFDDDLRARDHRRYDLFVRYGRLLSQYDLGVELGYSRIAYPGAETSATPLLRVDVGWNATARSRLSLHATRQFLDTASDALARTGTPADGIPESILTGPTILASGSPYRTRRFDLSYAYTGARTQLNLSPHYERRTYLDAGEFDQNVRGMEADLSWLARPRLRLGVNALYERIDFSQTGRQFRTRRLGVLMQYQWNRHWSLGADLSRYQRDINQPGLGVTQNVAYLSITYHNR